MRKVTKYVAVDTSTLKGLRKAEWYHAHGYTMYRSGLFMVLFYK